MTTENQIHVNLQKFKNKKRNLGSHKNYVELGLVDELEYTLSDLQAFLSEQKSILNSFDSEIAKITSQVSDLYRSIEFVVTDSYTFSSGKEDMNKLMDIATQLGVPVTDLYSPFDEYTSLMQEIEANSELLDEKGIMLNNLGLL